MVESGNLCVTLTDQHFWKGIWWDLVWIATGRSGFDTVVPIHAVGKGATGFSNVESMRESTGEIESVGFKGF